MSEELGGWQQRVLADWRDGRADAAITKIVIAIAGLRQDSHPPQPIAAVVAAVLDERRNTRPSAAPIGAEPGKPISVCPNCAGLGCPMCGDTGQLASCGARSRDKLAFDILVGMWGEDLAGVYMRNDDIRKRDAFKAADHLLAAASSEGGR